MSNMWANLRSSLLALGINCTVCLKIYVWDEEAIALLSCSPGINVGRYSAVQDVKYVGSFSFITRFSFAHGVDCTICDPNLCMRRGGNRTTQQFRIFIRGPIHVQTFFWRLIKILSRSVWMTPFAFISLPPLSPATFWPLPNPVDITWISSHIFPAAFHRSNITYQNGKEY